MENELELTAEQKLGIALESELQNLSESGRKSFTIDELESLAPKVYNILFDVCNEDDNENGIETNKFALIEDYQEGREEGVFNLIKK